MRSSRAQLCKQQLTMDSVSANRRGAAVDLAIAIGFFFVCYLSEPRLDPILRHGRGLAMAFATAAYQFGFEGLAPLTIMAVRRERFSDYGFTRRGTAKSVAMALVLAVAYDLGMSCMPVRGCGFRCAGSRQSAC